MRDLSGIAGAAWGTAEARIAPAPVETATVPREAEDARFNPYHAPAGPGGGEFTGPGGGGGGKGGSKGAKAAAAHQAHAAHVQHVQHVQHLQQQKQALLSQARADRAKAAVLEKQLQGLEHQAAVAAKTAAKAKAAAAKAKVNPLKSAAAKAAAQHHATAPAKKHATLQQRISALKTQITGLLDQAKADEAQAAAIKGA